MDDDRDDWVPILFLTIAILCNVAVSCTQGDLIDKQIDRIDDLSARVSELEKTETEVMNDELLSLD